MKGRKIGTAMVCAVCVFLIVSAFFAKDFVLYDYHMNVSDYHYAKTEEEKPLSADTIPHHRDFSQRKFPLSWCLQNVSISWFITEMRF